MVNRQTCAAFRFLFAVTLGCIFMNHRGKQAYKHDRRVNRVFACSARADARRLSPCPSTDSTSVTNEKELRREILRCDVGARRTIVFKMTELHLETTLSIESEGICLEGARNGTVVHCPPHGSAMVVR